MSDTGGGTVAVKIGESSGNKNARVNLLKKRFESTESGGSSNQSVISSSKSGKLSDRNQSYAEKIDLDGLTAEDVSTRVKQAKSPFVHFDKQLADFKQTNLSTTLSSTLSASETAIFSPITQKGTDRNNNNDIRDKVSTTDKKSNGSGVAPKYSVPIRSTARGQFERESFAVKRKAGFWQDYTVVVNSHIDVVSGDFDSDGPESVSDISVGKEEMSVSDDKAESSVDVGGEDVFSCDEETESDTEAHDEKPLSILSASESAMQQPEQIYVEIDGLPVVEDDACMKEEKPNGKRRVSFDTKPIKMYFTYTPEEYGRLDPCLDPVSASAEFELEKRIEKMNVFEVVLEKGNGGLGIRIIGFGVGASSGCEKLGIFIKVLTPGGAVERDGRIIVGDQLIEVNGTSLVGVTQAYASDVLRATSGQVRFLVGRMVDESCNDIRELLGLPLIQPVVDTKTKDSEQADDTITSDIKGDKLSAGVTDTDNGHTTAAMARPIAKPQTSFDADDKTLTLLNAIAKCKEDKVTLIEELDILKLEAKLAVRSKNTDNSVQFEQAYIQSKNALCESMVEHSRLTDERDIAWNIKRKLKETQDRLILDKKVLERRLAELERASDAAKKRKLELDKELSKQEILYKQLVDNNDALLETLSDLEQKIKMVKQGSTLNESLQSSSSEENVFHL